MSYDMKGWDTIRDQTFEIRKLALDATSFRVQCAIIGSTYILILNVPYLAVDPTFPHHLNSFDNVPINYGNGDLTNITFRSGVVTYYSNVINYTQQSAGRPYTTFATPLSSNKILMYITSASLYGTGSIPVDIKVNYTVLTTSTYRLSASISLQIAVMKLQFSMIIFNSDDVRSSETYDIIFDIWEIDNLGGFIEVPSAFVDNFILGLTDFAATDGICVITYIWTFTNVSGISGVKLEPSKPSTSAAYQYCALSRIKSTVFYMKTWQCTPDHPYFNSTTNLCQDACGLLYYANTSIYVCKRCEFACRECVNSTFCTKCDDVNDFRTLTNNSGKVSCLCSPRYHQDPLNSTNTVCLPCMANCLSCRNSTVCDGCDSLANYVLTPSNTCEICGYGCLSCNKSPYECVSCTTGMIADNTQQRCVCLPGTYASNLTVICLACDWTCATCSGPLSTDCLTCKNQTIFDIAQLKCICLAGTFNSDFDASCVACHWTCTTCSGPSSTDCLSCKNGTTFDIVQQKCVCLPGTYNEDLNASCSACHWTCVTCSGPSNIQCLQCSATTMLDNVQNQCVCLSKTYNSDLNASCLACHWTCETCSGPSSTECLQCNTETIFDSVQQKCVCLAGTYSTNLTINCLACHWTCETCSGPSSTECLQCNTETIFDNSQQKCVCLPGTYSSNLSVSCLACHWTCATCSGPSNTECIQCHNETIIDNAQQKCICFAGTFNSDLDASCVACHWTCETCSGNLSTECLLCMNETIFDNAQQKCVCLAGTFNSDSNASCVACHWTCTTCSGPLSTDCLSCNNETIFYSVQQECLCLDGTYNEDLNQTCLSCHQICETCTGPQSSECITFKRISNEKIENFKEFMDSTFGNPIFSFLNQFPGGRKIAGPLFAFFLNFDDFWLYNYHQRNYSEVIQSLMDKINDMQAQKWSLIQYRKIFDALGFNKENFQNFLSAKTSFTSKIFFDVENNSNGFFPNTPNFLFSNIFLTFMVFIVMKTIHIIVRHFKIAQILIEYSFWPFYFLMIIEGNLQYFSYILTFDMMKFFELTYEYKFLNIVTLFIIFGIFFFGGFAYFILKSHYGTQTKYLLSDVKNKLIGIFYVSSVVGLRNIFIGASHYFFEQDYQTKIHCLISIEVIFISIYFIVLSDKWLSSMIYAKGKIWFCSIIPGMIRIVLNFTFLLTYQNTGLKMKSIYLAFAEIQMNLIYCYMSLFMFATSLQLVKTLAEIAISIYRKYKPEQKKKTLSDPSQKIKHLISGQPIIKVQSNPPIAKVQKNHAQRVSRFTEKVGTNQSNQIQQFKSPLRLRKAKKTVIPKVANAQQKIEALETIKEIV